MIDPGVFTLVETTFLQRITDAFSTISLYASHLLYFFTIFELVVFGLLWAFSANSNWGSAVFKILKIGLILFILQNFSYLTGEVIQSFAQMGGSIARNNNVTNLLFNPSLIWQYGYNVGVALLQSASMASSGIGFPLVQLVIGLGILFVFGLLGIQIVLQIVGFYLVSLVALIFIPFGIFYPGHRLLTRAVQSVFKAGARVMVIIVVMSLMITILTSFNLDKIETLQNINQSLGVFFAGLLFLFFAIKLPTLVSDVVGEFSMSLSPLPISTVPASTASAIIPSVIAGETASSMQQATMISSPASSPLSAGTAISGGAAGASGPLQNIGAAEGLAGRSITHSSSAEKSIQQGMQEAERIHRSLSEQSLKEIKKLIKTNLAYDKDHP
ncbi:MAG: hypothetical protein A2X77_03595 [Gammaproteobacteria bacterium GWE2_42_36]|nr:MAG: hypothetical protein A2X77_03595 [Gammaproteobacteria bacterium GWE2_42_36]HCU05803.1 hypothetical protein [Coxiellaceae bacterium]